MMMKSLNKKLTACPTVLSTDPFQRALIPPVAWSPSSYVGTRHEMRNISMLQFPYRERNFQMSALPGIERFGRPESVKYSTCHLNLSDVIALFQTSRKEINSECANVATKAPR